MTSPFTGEQEDEKEHEWKEGCRGKGWMAEQI